MVLSLDIECLVFTKTTNFECLKPEKEVKKVLTSKSKKSPNLYQVTKYTSEYFAIKFLERRNPEIVVKTTKEHGFQIRPQVI